MTICNGLLSDESLILLFAPPQAGRTLSQALYSVGSTSLHPRLLLFAPFRDVYCPKLRQIQDQTDSQTGLLSSVSPGFSPVEVVIFHTLALAKIARIVGSDINQFGLKPVMCSYCFCHRLKPMVSDSHAFVRGQVSFMDSVIRPFRRPCYTRIASIGNLVSFINRISKATFSPHPPLYRAAQALPSLHLLNAQIGFLHLQQPHTIFLLPGCIYQTWLWPDQG